MVFSKSGTKPTCNIKVKGEPLEHVDRYPDQEIKRRIGIAKTAYKKMEWVLQSKL